MKISGFTFLRNAERLYYPVQASILSVLDLVDEFVIALAQGDEGDNTRELLTSLGSAKIKIIDTVWDLEKYPNGSEYAHQTDLAKENCTGDWLFYLQADEVIHEDDLAEIRRSCRQYLNDKNIEGFVFDYYHFYGDYQHYYRNHCWYKKEVRIIRNIPDIHSWRDAQSFRMIPQFEGNDYFRKINTRKLRCKILNARVFHYGWVRPPEIIDFKNIEVRKSYDSNFLAESKGVFDFGRLDYCKVFDMSHPKVMAERIRALHWQDKLRFNGPLALNRKIMKHEKLKYRLLSFIEENILGGYVIGGFKNYKILK